MVKGIHSKTYIVCCSKTCPCLCIAGIELGRLWPSQNWNTKLTVDDTFSESEAASMNLTRCELGSHRRATATLTAAC